jgi:hypothetical protein
MKLDQRHVRSLRMCARKARFLYDARSMAKDAPPKRSPYQAPPPSAWPAWTALAGVAALLALSVVSWGKEKGTREALEARFANLEASVTQLTTKVDQAARAARPPQRTGPDPERAYLIKTDGSPSKGRVGAPIVIAEFSDFQ